MVVIKPLGVSIDCELDEWRYIGEIMPEEWAFKTEKGFHSAIETSATSHLFPLLKLSGQSEEKSSFLDFHYKA